MILTFRANVVNATPAKAPVTLTLTSQARALQEIVVWSNTGTLDISKTGYRVLDRGSGRLLIPDAGSWGQENFAGPDEMNWAPIPSSPLRLDMNAQLIEGPPWLLTFQFYNVAAAPILVAGFAVVRDPFASLPSDELYEFASRLGAAMIQVGKPDMPLGDTSGQPSADVNTLVARMVRGPVLTPVKVEK